MSTCAHQSPGGFGAGCAEAIQTLQYLAATVGDTIRHTVKRPVSGGLGEEDQKAICDILLCVPQRIRLLEVCSPTHHEYRVRFGESTGHQASISQDSGTALFQAKAQHIDVAHSRVAAHQVATSALCSLS